MLLDGLYTWIQKYRRPVCATITVDGAWMDAIAKISKSVPQMATDAMNNIPKAASFVVI
jgi:hypothetical protein